jgi:hypothetical protein
MNVGLASISWDDSHGGRQRAKTMQKLVGLLAKAADHLLV